MKFNFKWKELFLLGVIVSVWIFASFFLEDSSTPNTIRLFETNLYVYTAYRVRDNEIRIAIVKSHLSNSKILYLFDHLIHPKELLLECQRHGECPAAFTPTCSLSGYIGTIEDDTLIGQEVESVTLINGVRHLKVKIRDVRRKTIKKRKHHLGVCVQPVFLHADWSQFIQFFEYWLNEGASKFYIYMESYTNEVKKIIDFYAQNSRADIELIEWSKLPSYSIDVESNPNFYWYRLEPFLSIFDCMHKARWSVDFVAQSDLDEIFHMVSGNSLIEHLNWLKRKYPAMASANFMSRRVKVPTYWDRISSPKEFNFAPLFEAQFETRVFKRPLYMKNIHIPERVKRFDIHFQRETEFIYPHLNISFVHLDVSLHHGLVLHLRRSDDAIFSWSGSIQSRELWMLANRLERNFLRRLQGNYTSLLAGQEKWPNVGAQVVSTIERCRQEQYKLKKKKCYSLSNCEAVVYSKFPYLSWHQAKNSWMVLASI